MQAPFSADHWRVFLLVSAALLAGCTGVSSSEPRALEQARDLVIGRVGVYYDEERLQADRIARAKQIRLAQSVQSRMSRFLVLAGLGSRSGRDVMWIKLTEFRLPNGARWVTGGMKGNDTLSAMVSADRGARALYANQFSAQLGAGDRTVAANYSANRAMKELVDSLAWEIAWDLSWVTGRRGEDALLDAGLEAGVVGAPRKALLR
jgi:hypothetical protein